MFLFGQFVHLCLMGPMVMPRGSLRGICHLLELLPCAGGAAFCMLLLSGGGGKARRQAVWAFLRVLLILTMSYTILAPCVSVTLFCYVKSAPSPVAAAAACLPACNTPFLPLTPPRLHVRSVAAAAGFVHEEGCLPACTSSLWLGDYLQKTVQRCRPGCSWRRREHGVHALLHHLLYHPRQHLLEVLSFPEECRAGVHLYEVCVALLVQHEVYAKELEAELEAHGIELANHV
mmetsp:Transcript_25161/g.70326  ORF Transcript_25161/g.70326 Transcript_25161/m.70326 type:complete len:232 (+) Transcript_25161:4582-5277(+)